MLDICTEVLRTPYQPAQSTKVTTIFIHKKGDPSLPENSNPITLEPVSLKIFTSLLRNRVIMYLVNNQFIERHQRKDFMPGMSGTFEHMAEMIHIINHSRKHQRSVTITLIDLENTFGEVRHSLIQSVLGYHNIPDEINCTVTLLYRDFRLSIIMNDFCTKHIAVEKDVLQGNSFSSLISNLQQSTRDVPWKIIYPKLGDTPTKIKMTPSFNFFCQGDLLQNVSRSQHVFKLRN